MASFKCQRLKCASANCLSVLPFYCEPIISDISLREALRGKKVNLGFYPKCQTPPPTKPLVPKKMGDFVKHFSVCFLGDFMPLFLVFGFGNSYSGSQNIWSPHWILVETIMFSNWM